MKKIKRNFLFIILSSLSSGLWTSVNMAQNFNPGVLNTGIMQEFDKNDTTKFTTKSPTGAMIRSLVFPGWGQFYNKKYFKAILVCGVEIGLIANSIYLNQKYLKSETDNEREFYINNRNISNWWLVGVILISMADAYVDAHLHNFDESPDLSALNISPIVCDNYVGIQLSICIYF